MLKIKHFMISLRKLIKKIITRFFYRRSAFRRWKKIQATINTTPEDREIADSVRVFTMTGPLRVHALLDAINYLVERPVEGAIVECGVWRGGSVMAAIKKLINLGVSDREIYMYDTFEGMTEPTSHDTSNYEPAALNTWEQANKEGKRGWHHLFRSEMFSEEFVRNNLLETGYPKERLHFVKGAVEETIPGTMPDKIALLRLDTDWYESTRHELEHLYPRLVSGGVLIIDDYGHWDGCKKAVDEYFSSNDVELLLLNRVDYAARIAVKI